MSSTARKQQRRVPVDWIGLRKLPDSDTRYNFLPTRECADEVTIGTTELTPWASSVFSESELEARLAVYADRASRGVSLFSDEPIEDSAPSQKCWGCGTRCGIHNASKDGVYERHGWHRRSVETECGVNVDELCCPDCWVAIGCRWYDSD